MSEKVYVTGIGIISSIGNGVPENYNALINKNYGIRQAELFKADLSSNFLFGEVNLSNEALISLNSLNKEHYSSRTALLGVTAAIEAIQNAQLSNSDLRYAGVVSGTSVGGMDVTEKCYKDYIRGMDVDIRRSFAAHDCGFSTEFIADCLGIKGYLSTVSTACSSSANSIAHASQLIKSGKLKIAVAGGADALSNFTFSGFNSLLILDPDHCKPFDETRKGLNLGEGAAYLVLESEDSMLKRKVRPLAEFTGFGNTSDAYHQTASSPDGIGATLAMSNALKNAGLEPSDISYINAHGTGTQNNDLSESVALKNIFGDQLPHYSSTKAYTGHTLGAAGAIEAVFCVLAIREDTTLANQNISKSMEILDRPPVQNCIRNSGIKHVLSNSFGFGGNCTALIFSKI